MLYVFNSAYRPLYTKNILNTLFLPYDWTNEYRYRHGQDSSNVGPETYAALPCPQARDRMRSDLH